jgi:tetratricopeptide (TPR) repeat protein
MPVLPGWNSLETTTRLHHVFELAGLVVLALLVIAEGLAYLYGHHKDWLRREAERLLSQNLAEYGEVATVNFRGTHVPRETQSVQTPLVGWIDTYVRDTSEGQLIRHDDEAIAYYTRLQEAYPKYPFSYYFLAEAYRRRGEGRWRDYAQKAIEIFTITTSLPHHVPNHDEALAHLQKMLDAQ